MIIDERERLVHVYTQLHCMVGTAVVFLVEDALALVTNCYRAHISARFNVNMRT